MEDYTKQLDFWKRLESFVSDVQTGCAMGEEEKDMILHNCKLKILDLQPVVNCKITDKIYQMPIHTSMEVNTGASTFDIVRVAGGWIYSIYRLDSNQMTSTFVPFDNEFMCDK